MTGRPSDAGAEAEVLAAAFLERRGLIIVERNFRRRCGELDLVARDGGTLVFVEVRLRRGNAFGGAAASITAAKRTRLVRAASLYLAARARHARLPLRRRAARCPRRKPDRVAAGRHLHLNAGRPRRRCCYNPSFSGNDRRQLTMDHVQRIRQHFADSAQLKIDAAETLAPAIARAAAVMTASLLADGKILACGNGGSAGDAQHFAAEMVGRFERERPELPAISLVTDTSILTAVANDYSFEQVFAKQVRALGATRRRAARHLDLGQLAERGRRGRGRARPRDAHRRADRA